VSRISFSPFTCVQLTLSRRGVLPGFSVRNLSLVNCLPDPTLTFFSQKSTWFAFPTSSRERSRQSFLFFPFFSLLLYRCDVLRQTPQPRTIFSDLAMGLFLSIFYQLQSPPRPWNHKTPRLLFSEIPLNPTCWGEPASDARRESLSNPPDFPFFFSLIFYLGDFF